MGKAAAVMIPTLVLSYVVFGLFLAVVRLFAKAQISSGVFHQGPMLLALVLFTPLLAGWAVVVGMAMSVRASEVRVAQQLGTLASLPALGVVVLFAVGVIHPTFGSLCCSRPGCSWSICARCASRPGCSIGSASSPVQGLLDPEQSRQASTR